MSDKISTKQLERAAYVYIRQSTLQQVRHNWRAIAVSMHCGTGLTSSGSARWW